MQSQVADAIRQIRREVRWRQGKAAAHLNKRIYRGDLLPTTTLTDYNAIIQFIVQQNEARVYVFQYGDVYYPTIVTAYQERIWLVMFATDGVMETAFPPDKAESYFKDPKYHLVGSVEEVLK